MQHATWHPCEQEQRVQTSIVKYGPFKVAMPLTPPLLKPAIAAGRKACRRALKLPRTQGNSSQVQYPVEHEWPPSATFLVGNM
mmetsp:Transcript_72093/g.120052  ORF Transcript_72093/g.120052 Transcript_72093/m.120052 type:complete len:83 (+) Transcript_72093:124-372(+)